MKLDPKLVYFFIENENNIKSTFDGMGSFGYNTMTWYTNNDTFHFNEGQFKLFQRDRYLYTSKLYKALA